MKASEQIRGVAKAALPKEDCARRSCFDRPSDGDDLPTIAAFHTRPHRRNQAAGSTASSSSRCLSAPRVIGAAGVGGVKGGEGSSRSSMTAVLEAVGKFRFENRPVPPPPPGQLQLKIERVGICGSDLQYFSHGIAGGVLKIDFTAADAATGWRGVLGHETAATVVALGEGVENFAIGDLVVLEAGIPCLRCSICKEGKYNLCQFVRFLGSYVNQAEGTIRQYFNYPAEFTFQVPAGVSVDEAALVEPLSVAVSAVRRGRIGVGMSVLVTGAGPVGLLCMQVAAAAGASVTVTDVVASRLELATRLGATSVVNTKLEPSSVPRVFDVSIECSGSPAALASAIAAIKSGGVVVVVGNQHGPSTSVPLQDLCRREIDLRGVLRYCNCYPAAIDLIATKRVDVRTLVTHTFPIGATQEAFETFARGEAVKVLISPHATSRL